VLGGCVGHLANRSYLQFSDAAIIVGRVLQWRRPHRWADNANPAALIAIGEFANFLLERGAEGGPAR